MMTNTTPVFPDSGEASRLSRRQLIGRASALASLALAAPSISRHASAARALQTPAATGQGPEPLLPLLASLPATVPGTEGRFLPTWIYADIAQRFADLGLSIDTMTDRAMPLALDAYSPLVNTTGLFDFAADDEFVAAIGFDPYAVQQVLVAGARPDMVTLLRGDWDADSLATAWETSGYQQGATDEGVTIWTLGRNGEVDPAHPIQSRMFSDLNNVAILDDNILAFAGHGETVQLLAATHASQSESARDDADMAPLVATLPDTTMSLIAFDRSGTELYDVELMAQNSNISPEDLAKMQVPFEESRQAVGPMPDYSGAIFGMTSEGGAATPVSATPVTGEGESAYGGEVIVRLGAHSEEDAAQIATVVEWRWDNFLSQRSMRPLNTIMELTQATTQGTTVVLSFDPIDSPSIWIEMLNSNDLRVFAVDSETDD